MNDQPLTISSYPRAILHIDGDAFFASCEQSRNPALKGKPVVTGRERGIVSSMSYEVKARGVTRGMRLSEVKKLCPDVIMLPSDYETYSLLSKRFISIVRRYTPDVDEYSIDECFADITGLQRIHHMSYRRIAEKIKQDLDTELGFTFSVGLGPNKVIAKIGSKWQKPSGLTVIPGIAIHRFLANLPVEKIWGIGGQTTALLAKYGVHTALQFAHKPEEWVQRYFSKPFYEIWQELNGKFVLALNTKEKTSYQSIQKMRTFSPPSTDKNVVFSQLSKNIENACIKLRRYRLATKNIIIFLRTQSFYDHTYEIHLSRDTAFPEEIIRAIEPAFDELFKPAILYRSTGVILFKLNESNNAQLDLFSRSATVEKMTRMYEGVDAIKKKYGKHTIYLGSSYYANNEPQHNGDRGETPERKKILFKGESARKRLSIPMFMGEIK